jgi:hypothetical protein
MYGSISKQCGLYVHLQLRIHIGHGIHFVQAYQELFSSVVHEDDYR